jgi:transposase
MRAHTLFTGLEAAFTSFGDVPAEVIFDPMRAVVLRDLLLEEAQAAGRVAQRLKALTHPTLMIVDDVG